LEINIDIIEEKFGHELYFESDNDANDSIIYKDHIVSKRSASNSTSANSNISPNRDFASPFSNSMLLSKSELPTIFEIEENNHAKKKSSNSSVTLKTNMQSPKSNSSNKLSRK